MKKRVLIGLLAFSLVITPTFAKDKNREWQNGKLLSIKEGPPETYRVYAPGSSGGTPENKAPLAWRMWVYEVETETSIFKLSAPGQGFFAQGGPRPIGAIGSQVRFAIDSKGDAFLIEENGKELKARVVETAVKLPDKAKPAEATPPKDAGAEKPSESREPGTVAVTTTPEAADVYVDGAFIGNAPATLHLAPGEHIVKVTAPKYKDWSRKISVLSGSESKLVVNLERP